MPRGSELLGTPAPAAPAPAAKAPAKAPAPASAPRAATTAPRAAAPAPRAPAPAPTPRRAAPAAARPAAPAARPAPAPAQEPNPYVDAIVARNIFDSSAVSAAPPAPPAPPASSVDNYAELIGVPGVERRAAQQQAFDRLVGAPEVGEPEPGTGGLSRAYERRMRARAALVEKMKAETPVATPRSFAEALSVSPGEYGEPGLGQFATWQTQRSLNPAAAKGEVLPTRQPTRTSSGEVSPAAPYEWDPYAVVEDGRVTTANPADVVKPRYDELWGLDETGRLPQLRDRAKGLEQALRAVKAERRRGELKVDKIEEKLARARKTGAPDQDRLAAQASDLNAAMRVLRQRQANVARSLGEHGYSPDEVKSIE